MKCPKCQAINGELRIFCKQCGFRLLLNCPQCSFANEVGDVYCGGCGKNLTDSVSAISQPTHTASRSQASSDPSLSQAFLTNLLKEEPAEAQADSKEEKKAVSQEEIDKLFNN